MKVDFTSFKVCKTCAKHKKKSAQSLHKVCKTSKKVCIFSAKCTLCRLMHTFEKVCTNLPPDVRHKLDGYQTDIRQILDLRKFIRQNKFEITLNQTQIRTKLDANQSNISQKLETFQSNQIKLDRNQIHIKHILEGGEIR